jgi:hypothetical protein
MTPLAAWRQAFALAARRPLLFLPVSLALAGTDLLLWSTGVLDGARPSSAAGAAFLIAKLAILLGWALLALRLLDAPDRAIGIALRLDRRQLGWLAGTLPVLLLLLGLRLTLTGLAALALPPRPALIASLAVYLVVSMILLVRLLPALIGVLLGDRVASLGRSWRATRGWVFRAVAFLLMVMVPPLALHVGLTLVSTAQGGAIRAAILLADGAVMALALAVAMAGYRALWLRAKATA